MFFFPEQNKLITFFCKLLAFQSIILRFSNIFKYNNENGIYLTCWRALLMETKTILSCQATSMITYGVCTDVKWETLPTNEAFYLQLHQYTPSKPRCSLQMSSSCDIPLWYSSLCRSKKGGGGSESIKYHPAALNLPLWLQICYREGLVAHRTITNRLDQKRCKELMWRRWKRKRQMIE